MKKIENFCPVRDILDHIGDKWSVLTLLELDRHGILRFGQLSKNIPDVSPKMLTVTLRSLEKHNLVVRTVYPEVPPKVEYCLSDDGRSLITHIESLVGWALKHRNNFTQTLVEPTLTAN